MMRRLVLAACSGSLLIAFSVSCPAAQSADVDDQSGFTGTEIPAEAEELIEDPASLDAARELLDSYSEEEREILDYWRLDEVLVAMMIESDGIEVAKERIQLMLGFEVPGAPREAEVVLGQPLNWRELAVKDPGSGLSWGRLFTPGNFDDDPAEEILYYRQDEIEVLELDGSSTKLEHAYTGDPPWSAWDYDGDGIDDLYYMDPGPADPDADVMIFHSLAGETLGYLPGHPMGPEIAIGDLDGDGKLDLFMAGEGPYGDDNLPGVGFSTGGEVILQVDPYWASPYTITGDIDGDGKDEVFNSFAAGMVHYTGQDVVSGRLSGSIPIELSEFYVSWCYDFDEDGREDLVGADGLVLDADGKQLFSFEVPQGWDSVAIDGVFGDAIHALEVNDVTRIAICAPLAGGVPGSFGLWDTAGSLQYLEYMGEEIQRSFLVYDAGGDHVVLLTDTRILCWP